MSDDFIFIVDNQANWLSAWAQDSYRAAGFEGAPAVVYRPLGLALLATLQSIFEATSPMPYRVLAVLMHAGNAILLALWLRGLGLSDTRALIAAALWSVMPIHAEAVFWASASFDVMASATLLGALVLATRPSTAARVGAVGLWVLSFLIKETTLFGLAALLFTMAFCTPAADEGRQEARPAALGLPAVLGGLAIAAWWSARDLASVQAPASIPLDWSALAASLGEALLRAIGLGDLFRAGGPPLHGVSLVSGIVLLAAAWYVWKASHEHPKIMLPVLSLILIGAAQVVFGQSETGFLVDPDRYFYLSSASISVCAVCLWNPSKASNGATSLSALTAGVSVAALLVAWSWGAVSARASYVDFESMLSREIRVGRASGYVYFLRGVERMKRADPCAAEMDFRSSFALEPTEAKRAQARELGIRALEACSASKQGSAAPTSERP